MPDAVVYSVMRRLVLLVAKFWTDYIRPAVFDQVFYLPGVRVRVIIEEYKTDADTMPLRRPFDEDYERVD